MKPTSATSHAGEIGWLPDCVYTGAKFESGVAFFSDALGRISRFSREPADLEAAKPLRGQAALPGLVNGHAQSWQRALRGRTEPRSRAERETPERRQTTAARVAGALGAEDLYDTACMAFLEMLLSGITCVGEFHTLHHQPDGAPWPDPILASAQILRAARDSGIRIALSPVAYAKGHVSGAPAGMHPRMFMQSMQQFTSDMDALRRHTAANHPGDDAWLGVGVSAPDALSLQDLKALAAHAHANRLRIQIPLSETPASIEAFRGRHGSTPVTWLAAHGLIHKRFIAIHAGALTDDEIRLMGEARAAICCCPAMDRAQGVAAAPADRMLGASITLALGTGAGTKIELLEDARSLEYQLRVQRSESAVLGPDVASVLFHAATAGGARSLGAPSGSLEIGRPADFFTVSLHDPSLVSAGTDALLHNVVFSLERRAIRDVWVGARRRVANGRHFQHGQIIGRFADSQRRLWHDAGA